MTPTAPRRPRRAGRKLVDVWLENQAGERVENVRQGEPIGFNLVVEADEVSSPAFLFRS